MTPDDDLSRLIHDSVSDVEPGEGLLSIQHRTKVVPMSRKRPWSYAVAGAVVATAAVVAAIALAGGSLPGFDQTDDTPVATSPTSPAPATPSESASPSAIVPSASVSEPDAPVSSSVPPVVRAVPVYYVGDGPQGPVLFREFHPGTATDPLQAAIDGLQSRPLDPDYSTPWRAGSFAGASYDATGQGLITVTLADASLRNRPASMSQAYAASAIQQVIYTLQAATQTRAPVRFELGTNPVGTVLGEPTSEPLAQGKPLKVLSLMNISTPNEGAVVSGRLTVAGVNNGFEATVVLRLVQGSRTVLTKAGIASGWMGDKLFPWQLTLDLSKVAPGQYTLVASNDDPSGGAEGHGPATDTRTIIVK